ncbi:MAG: hypothetical protein Q6K70_07610 [Thermostichales cyanobacterium DRC_bins_46]
MVKSNYPLPDFGIPVEPVSIFASDRQRDEMVARCWQIYQRRPFVNSGGMMFATALAYATFLQRVQPNLVIESGIWRGFSTWWIEQLFPDTQLICLDPVLMMPLDLGQIYRSPRAAYSTHDFSCITLPEISREQSCAIFDDHQNALPRLEQAWNLGIPSVLYDDNLSQPTYHTTLTHLIQRRDPILPTLFAMVEEYFVFPPLVGPVPEGCPLAPLYEDLPDFLAGLDPTQELSYTWVTFLKAVE